MKVNRHSATPGGRFPKQRGAVLIISLIVLLLMTLIGVTSMQNSNLQERMAGNTLEMNRAFQAAEMALRQAEANLTELQFRNAELQLPLLDPVAWDTTTHLPVALSFPAEATVHLAQAPIVYVAPSTMLIHGITASSMSTEKFFPITTRASGGVATTTALLQSTVKVIE